MPKKNLISLTGKNKLLEAAFKEKEFDPYFCLSLVLTLARNIFIQEVTKAADVYIETCDSQNSALVIKRLMKNIKENNLNLSYYCYYSDFDFDLVEDYSTFYLHLNSLRQCFYNLPNF